ncbi:hypothetical protein [Candidatus Halobonum tyrrellensis]|uniref:Uncharacterized protein n=1 Tax=Candidatus Halobonum tyrrellensis G22 TaxID=1324957 RepID=V4J2B3_9EURY|nr:hypothetical protein [Candidatus Halobonum tyrrellensis]ESP89552.1 hypothetical protein K933_03310 [Candidatus Halobonum tyrrellensis G22]
MSRAADGAGVRELDCDFCGATAAGAYEVLPASLDPAPDEQVRVVLCGDCRETLDGVVAPLLARLGGTGDGAADGGSVAAGPPAGASASSASGPSGSGGGSAPASARESGSESDARADTDYDAQADARSGGPDSPSDDAVIIDASKRGPDAEAADESDDADAGDGSTGADAKGEDGSPTDANTDPSEEPEGFRQVMRLLGNREFPVDRAEVVDLAGSAYDLDRSESDRVIDYAVDNDVLEEDDGELRKT